MNPTSSTSTTANNHTDTMAKRVDAIVHATQDAAGEIKDKAIAAKDAVVDKGGSLIHSLTKTIKARPIASVLVAVGIGYIAMRLIRMRA